MFLFQELRFVPEHRQSEALDRQFWIHGLMAAHPGFQRAIACRYGGTTDRYAWFRFWDRDEDQVSFRRSPAADYSGSRPVGLYEPLANAIAGTARWDCVIESGKPGGDFLVRTVFRVDATTEPAFLVHRRRYDELALASGGVTSVWTFRALDEASAGLFVTLLQADGRDAYNTFLESTGLAAYREKLPDGLSETLAVECYEIVHEVLPG